MPSSAEARYATVLFLNDGQNLFDGSISMSGTGWEAATAARTLLPALGPIIVVGIDHMSANRSLYYCPARPGTGAFPAAGLEGFRPEAAAWPGGQAASYVDRVVADIVPFVLSRYGVLPDPDRLLFGGSSFGGIASLVMAMRHPSAFGSVLVESPSLWINGGRFLDAVVAHEGPWPARMFVAMGGREYSGTRERTEEAEAVDAAFLQAFETMVEALRQSGMGPRRLTAKIDRSEEGAAHTELSWQTRLPEALEQLLVRCWFRGVCGTAPRLPVPGSAATVFLDALAGRVLDDKAEEMVSGVRESERWTWAACEALRIHDWRQRGSRRRIGSMRTRC